MPKREKKNAPGIKAENGGKYSVSQSSFPSSNKRANTLSRYLSLSISLFLLVRCFVPVFSSLSLYIKSLNPIPQTRVNDPRTPFSPPPPLPNASGVLLNVVVSRFPAASAFQPVINGVGGNLVAVLASRISTRLHRQKKADQNDDDVYDDVENDDDDYGVKPENDDRRRGKKRMKSNPLPPSHNIAAGEDADGDDDDDVDNDVNDANAAGSSRDRVAVALWDKTRSF